MIKFGGKLATKLFERFKSSINAMSEEELDSWCLVGLCILGSIIVSILCIIILFIRQNIKHFGIRGACQDKLSVFSLLTMQCSFIYVGFDWHNIYFLYKKGYGIMETSEKWEIICNDIIYYSTTILLYITLVLRIHTLFKGNTVFQINKIHIISLAGLMILDVVAISLFITSLYDTMTGFNIFSFLGSNSSRLVTSALVVIVNDIAINGLILYIILSKLYKIISLLNHQFCRLVARAPDCDTNTNNTHIDENTSGTSHDTSLLNEINRNQNEQQLIVDLITKMSLLTIICVMFGQLFPITAIYTVDRLSTDPNVSALWFNEHSVLCFTFRAIEALINCTVLYLTFVFSQDKYDSYCYLCHTCLKKCCTYCIVKQNIRLMKKNIKHRVSDDNAKNAQLAL